MKKQTGKLPPELQNLVELPDSTKEVWSWFLKLNRKRPSGFGISEITYSEMLSFFLLNSIEPTEQEIELIEIFDSIAVNASKEFQQKEELRNKRKQSKR